MKIVVDTNLVFSAILNSDNKIGDLLLNSYPTLEFYTCNLLIEEIEEHKSKLLALKNYTEIEFETVKNKIFKSLHFISEAIIPYEFWNNALPFVRDVDMDDIAFVALNDFLNTKLWTGDKKLLLGLRAKGYLNILSTNDLYDLRFVLEQ